VTLSDWIDVLRVVWAFLTVVHLVRVVRAVIRKYRGAPPSQEEAAFLLVLGSSLLAGWFAILALERWLGH
jgi:hypothetical protein